MYFHNINLFLKPRPFFTKPKLMNSTLSTIPDSVQETDTGKNFSLSVITGFALLGLLVTSIWDFGGFTTNIQTFFYSNAHHGNYQLLTLISVLFEGKMLEMLAILFGAGIVALLQKKEQIGSVDGADIYIRRQIWLILLGLFVGFIFIWPNDILFPLGVVGILVFAFSKISVKGLFIAALVCTVIYCGKNFWKYADDTKDYKAYLAVKEVEKKFVADSTARAVKLGFSKTKDSASQKTIIAQKIIADSIAKKKDTLTGTQVEEKEKWEMMVKSLKYDSAKVESDKKSMRGRYAKIWFYLKGQVQSKESSWIYRFGVWELAAAMFLGMALWGIGFFQKRFSKATYLAIAAIFIGLGVAISFFRIHATTIRILDYANYIDRFSIPYNQLVPIEKIVMALGYASLLMWLLKINALQWLIEVFASVGKLALTNYFIQVFISAFWFYGYGLGYYGRFEQWELYAAVAEITMLQIAFSLFWLRTYKMGPLEWALKCIIYRKRVTNKL